MSYVYLMSSAGRYKIGRADNVERRWRTFRTADPDIRIEHVIPTRQAAQLESELHKNFERKRINLEWYRLDSADVRFIKSLGGQAGRWLERSQARRRFYCQLSKLAQRVMGLLLRLALLAVMVIALLWFCAAAAPGVRQALISIGR